MDRAKYKQIVEVNLFQSTKHLHLGQKYAFQLHIYPKTQGQNYKAQT